MNKIGVVIKLDSNTDVLKKMRIAMDSGFECCQLVVWDMNVFNDTYAEAINNAVNETGMEISTLWSGWTGPREWNFTGGPMTLGLVPVAYRMQRAEELVKAGEFAVKIGVTRVATHVGFLPENINDPEYFGVIATIRYIARKYKELGLNFLFETGQETPIVLLRVIEEIGKDNIGINMDTANLILYGKGNSADAITVFGKYVMDTHIKDGFYPTEGRCLGKEVKVGEGLANIPEVIRRLNEIGYKGNYIIEREITGEQQTKDILETLGYLKKIIK